MKKDEIIKLIAGRIEDEFRKHSLLDWKISAASKIYSQWFEFLSYENLELNQATENLMKSRHELQDEIDSLKNDNSILVSQYSESSESYYKLQMKCNNEIERLKKLLSFEHSENINLSNKLSESQKEIERLKSELSLKNEILLEKYLKSKEANNE